MCWTLLLPTKASEVNDVGEEELPIKPAAKPLAHAYAHRDCEYDPPLWRSLEAGFPFIEADVYSLFGRTLVAHDLQQLRPWRTLQKLYLDPLRHYLQHQGSLFADKRPLWLFIDVKTPAGSSYAALHKLLASYSDMLTTFTPETVHQGVITVIISGNRIPYRDAAKLPLRYAALDGRAADLGVHTDPGVMPVISDNWRKHFRWAGHGPVPDGERQKLETMVHTVHQHGQKLRFWGTPDDATPAREAVWDTLLEAGVDLLNTDDLEGLKGYLERRSPEQLS